MNTIKVVLDTNVFTQEHFRLIDSSRIRELCKRKRILLIYGHVFLEETLRAYGNPQKRDALVNQWLPFIADTAVNFCKDFNQIFHEELVQGKGSSTRVFMSENKSEALARKLRNVPIDGSWPAWESTKLERESENIKRLAQREVSKSIRNEIADWRKTVNYKPNKHGKIRLTNFLDKETDELGRSFIKVIIQCKNPIAIGCMWSKNKCSYPYFTNFAINMLYIAYHAMIDVNDQIDINAQADLNLMSHLMIADILVSNETGFLRKAFNDLWAPRNKVIFTSSEFVDYLEHL